jgi:nitrite reductase/ring-hydroxylating ferredoxin subunit
MAFVAALKVADVPPQRGKFVRVGDHALAVFCVADTYYALDNECPHRGGILAEGTIVGQAVMCPLHPAQFDLASGRVLCPPAKRGVTSYPCRVVGEYVEIDVPTE